MVFDRPCPHLCCTLINMDILDQENGWNYCLEHSSAPNDHLSFVERNTHLRAPRPGISVGFLVGRFLSFISCAMQPSAILEIGTFSGYSSICLAEGLQEHGILITIESERYLEPLITEHIGGCPQKDQIQLIIGKALEVLPSLNHTFDLVFIDAAKKEYQEYFELVLDKVRPGGVIIADNVLWKGEVVHSPRKGTAKYLHSFNERISRDERVACTLLPLRDGMMMITKK